MPVQLKGRSENYVLRFTPDGVRALTSSTAFTLIELILVMTVLTIAVSLTAPALANFFRGRSLDSEARKLLAVTRFGQSRAVSEGIPMELWLDATRGAYGLEAEPSYETTDPKAQEFTVDSDMQLQVSLVNNAPTTVQNAASPVVTANHPNLPKIRFLPDGSIAETSPQSFAVMSRDGSAIWLAQTRNRLSYAITNR
jgi:Tfp pilus assembly protein FimT